MVWTFVGCDGHWLMLFSFPPWAIMIIFIDFCGLSMRCSCIDGCRLTCEKSSDRGEDRPRLAP
jgi:hypothetical protein